MARRRTKVDKVIDDLEEILNDHHFLPSLMANMITTSYPPYTQQKLIELVECIKRYHDKENELHRETQTAQYSRQ